MMKFISLLSTIIFSVSVKAQVQIIPVVDTSFYIGIGNIVTLKSTNIPLNQLSLQTSNGKIYGKDGNYIIHCAAKKPDVILKVVYKNKVVASKTININFITDPIAYAAGDSIFNNGNITKKQLHSLKSLIIKVNYPLAKFIVTKFTFEIIHLEKSKGVLENNSFTLSSDVNFYLKYAEVGDDVIFDNITVVGPDSRGRQLNPIMLKVIQ